MKKIIKKLFSVLGFQLTRMTLKSFSDDPIFVITKLFNPLSFEHIIDGGASIGTFSQNLSKHFPNSLIHSFEPHIPHYNNLCKISKSKPNIIPIPKALSDNIKQKVFFLNQSSGTNSFFQSNSDSNETYGNQLKQIGKTIVECTTLDNYIFSNHIRSVDILKLDLQGGELAALNGSNKSLNSGIIKCILCEIMFEKHYNNQPNAGKLLNLLINEYGFTLFNFYQHNYHHGKLIYADALLIHSDIVSDVTKKSKNTFLPFSKYPLLK